MYFRRSSKTDEIIYLFSSVCGEPMKINVADENKLFWCSGGQDQYRSRSPAHHGRQHSVCGHVAYTLDSRGRCGAHSPPSPSRFRQPTRRDGEGWERRRSRSPEWFRALRLDSGLGARNVAAGAGDGAWFEARGRAHGRAWDMPLPPLDDPVVQHPDPLLLGYLQRTPVKRPVLYI
jgi:hypothetical protein